MKKNIIIIIGIVVVVVIAGVVWWLSASQQQASQQQTPQGEVAVGTSTPETVPVTQEKSSSTVTGAIRPTVSVTVFASSIPYGTAVNRFVNSRIQIDGQCDFTPSSIHLLNGKTLMLDNRSTSTLTVSINGTKFTVSGEGYKLATLESTRLPETVTMNCESGKNNGTILLQ